jgi:hypothetical protein
MGTRLAHGQCSRNNWRVPQLKTNKASMKPSLELTSWGRGMLKGHDLLGTLFVWVCTASCTSDDTMNLHMYTWYSMFHVPFLCWPYSMIRVWVTWPTYYFCICRVTSNFSLYDYASFVLRVRHALTTNTLCYQLSRSSGMPSCSPSLRSRSQEMYKLGPYAHPVFILASKLSPSLLLKCFACS